MVGAAQQIQQAFLVVARVCLQGRVTDLYIAFQLNCVKAFFQYRGVGQFIYYAGVLHQIRGGPATGVQ